MKAILVSGTPGTGKTSIAKAIAKHFDLEYIHIGEHEEYVTAETNVKIIDVEKMNEWLKNKQENNPKGIVVDSHLSHYYPSELTKVCIITRCDPSELKNRLKKRGYPPEKIKLNLEAEAMDLILQEAIQEGHQVHEVNTTNKTTEISSEETIKAINNEEYTYGKNDFTYYIKNL